MQIAIEKDSRIALFRGADLVLTEEGLRTGYFLVPDLTPDNCELHASPDLPGPWLSGMYRLDGGALVLTPDGEAWAAERAAQEAQDAVDAVARAAQEEVQLIEDKIEALWAAADRYTSRYISGAAFGILAIGEIRQYPKCLAATAWVDGVWATYYMRKDMVTAISVDDHDFSAHGAMPYSVPEFKMEMLA